MSTTTETTRQTGTETGSWQAGVLGGILGAVVMGGLMLAMNDAVIAVAIPSLYTLAPPPNPAAGLFVHISHGAVLGVVFAGIAGAANAESSGKLLGLGLAWGVVFAGIAGGANVESSGKLLGLGLAWGVVVWVTMAALLMPVWLSAVGSPASPPFPNFAPPSLFWHAVYGLVLGGVYAGLKDAL